MIRRIMSRSLTPLLALSLGATAPASGANLLVNGSFESGPAPGPYLLLSAGSTVITGWTVTRTNVHYCSTALWQVSNGSRNIDLDGGTNGGVKQTFATVPGAVYQVSWDLAGNPANAPTIKTMKVEAASQVGTFTFSTAGKGYSNMGYIRPTWSFTANSTSTTIEFYSVTSPTGFGPVIDNVVVDASTPARSTSWGRLKAMYH